MKRITLAVLVATLVTAPVPAVLAAPRKAPVPLCVSYADAAADSGPAAPLNDAALDITKVRFSTVAKSLVTQITLSKYAERPTAGAGGRYQVAFNVDGKLVEIYWKNGPFREEEANVFYQQGVRVDGTFIHDGVKGSVAGNVVTMEVKLTMLKSAVGSAVEGDRAGEVVAYAMASHVGRNQTWDTANGPASGFVIGQTCR